MSQAEQGGSRGTVGLFATCLIDNFRPNAGFAAAAVEARHPLGRLVEVIRVGRNHQDRVEALDGQETEHAGEGRAGAFAEDCASRAFFARSCATAKAP